MAEATGLQGEELGRCTDLSQCTIAQRYRAHDQNRSATFSLIVRACSPNHAYPVAAGGVPGVGTIFAAGLAVSAAEGALSRDLGGLPGGPPTAG